MTERITIPVRDVGGEKWCSLEFMGIKSIDVVAYKFARVGQNRCPLVQKHEQRLILQGTSRLSLKKSSLIMVP